MWNQEEILLTFQVNFPQRQFPPYASVAYYFNQLEKVWKIQLRQTLLFLL